MAGVALIAVAKNEACYLHEWVYHHLNFGFAKIYIGINRTDDNSKDIISLISKAYPQVKFFDTTWIDLSANQQNGFNRNIQTLSYAYLIHQLEGEAISHILPLDIDEFWYPTDFKSSIQDYIAKVGYFDCMSFNWACQYGESTEFTPPFLCRSYSVDRHVKSLFTVESMRKILSLKCHTPLYEGDIKHLDANGHSFEPYLGQKSDKENNVQCAFVLHRLIRSRLEFKALIARGNPEDGTKAKNNRKNFVSVDRNKFTLNLDDELVANYHDGLNEFIDETGVLDLISDAREQLLISRMNPDSLSLENERKVNKIFQIGFNKCATGSIYEYFLNNGFRSAHWEGGDLSKKIYENASNGNKLLDGIEDQYQVFTDMEHEEPSGRSRYAYYDHFASLNEQYPNSLFILNYRDKESWIKSRLKHPGYLKAAQRADKASKKAVIASWSAHYDNQIKQVLKYFKEAGSANLLVLDLENSKPNDLSDFLEGHCLTIKHRSLPHSHKTNAKKSQLDCIVDTLRDVAISYERSDIKNVSLKLMEVAYRFRSQGKTIRARREAYNKILRHNELASYVCKPSRAIADPKNQLNKIKNAALYFESEGEISIALELMEVALFLRPDELSIAKKVTAYKVSSTTV